MKVTIIPIVVGAFGTVAKGLLKGLEDLEVGDHPNYSIIENGQNTEKSPGDLRRLTVTQTPVKNTQLTLMQKTQMRLDYNYIGICTNQNPPKKMRHTKFFGILRYKRII